MILEVGPGAESVPIELKELSSRARLARAGGGAPHFVGDLPPGRLREILTPVLEMRALLPLVRIKGRVTPLNLRNRDGKIVLRLRVETGRVFLPGDEKGKALHRRLRLLPLKGYAGAHRRVSSLLSGQSFLSPAETDLFDEALAVVGRTPGHYSSKLRFSLNPDHTAWDAMAIILLTLLETMGANEKGIVDDVDTEFLHDFRVAVRRTRSALSQLRKVFPSRLLARFRRELAWLGTATGAARDMDVYLLDFPHYREELPPGSREDLEPLREFLQARRGKEHRALVKVLRSARYRRLKESWRLFLEKPLSPRSFPPAASLPVREIATRRIRKMYRRAIREGERIDASSPPKALHELRISCKKLRYLLEFFQSLYPPQAMERLISALKDLQDNLGRFQDLHVQSESLQTFIREMEAAGSTPAGTFVAMGMLVEGKTGRQEECRRDFHRLFRAFAAPANRRLVGDLFREGSGAGSGS